MTDGRPKPASERPQGGQQIRSGPVQDEGVHVVAAGHGFGHVLGPGALRGPVEAGRAGEFGVDPPAAESRAEPVVRAGRGGAAVGVVADGQLADAGFPRSPCASNVRSSSAFGSVAITRSPCRPASPHDRGPDTAMPIAGGSSGRSHNRAFSTSKCAPWWLTYPPANSLRMMSTASSSISSRTCAAGRPAPTMCSFRFSPEPSPRRNLPSERSCMVAAFCATTAGW